jgi:predicted AAA+ superfamily ATPase
MKRQVYEKLLAWKNRENRKPLVIKGVRQTGKTWLIRNFGEHEFSSFVYVNCDSNYQVKELFENDFDTSRILRGLSAVSGVNIILVKR